MTSDPGGVGRLPCSRRPQHVMISNKRYICAKEHNKEQENHRKPLLHEEHHRTSNGVIKLTITSRHDLQSNIYSKTPPVRGYSTPSTKKKTNINLSGHQPPPSGPNPPPAKSIDGPKANVLEGAWLKPL